MFTRIQDVAPGAVQAYAAKSSGFSVTSADRGKFFDCTGDFTIALPSASGLTAGFSFFVRNASNGVITLDGSASETINGSLTLRLEDSRGEWMVTFNGSNWVTRHPSSANVRDFGAVGDGVADDTVAIQSAIDSKAGRIVFPKGVYRTTSTLTVTEAIVLEGQAAGTAPSNHTSVTQAFIKHDFSGTCINFVGSPTSNTIGAGSGVRNLSFLQNHGTGTGASGVCVRSVAVSDAQRCNWIRIENCQFEEVTGKNGWSYCVELDGTAVADLLRDVFISGCRFVSGSLATASVRLAGCANVFLRDCESNLSNANLLITGDATHLCSSIFVSGCTWNSIQIDYAQNCQIIGGSTGSYSTTSNTVDTIATGTAVTGGSPTILGTRNVLIGKRGDGRLVFTHNNTTAFVTGLNDVEFSGPIVQSVAGAASVTIGTSSAGQPRSLYFKDSGGTKYNWMIAAQQNLDNVLEITPSTAVGGSTFSSPALRISSAGAVTIPSTTTGGSGTGALVIGGGASFGQDIHFAGDGDGGSKKVYSPLGDLIRHRRYGFSNIYTAVQIGDTSRGIGFGIDPSANSGGQFTGNNTDFFFARNVAFGCANSGATDWVWALKIAGGASTKASPQVEINDSGLAILSGAYLQLGNAAVAATPTPTHTLTVRDSTGTVYRIPCVV